MLNWVIWSSTELKRYSKRGQKGANGPKQDQTGPNGAKQGTVTFNSCYQMIFVCYSLSVNCYLSLAIFFLLFYTFLSETCNYLQKLFPFTHCWTSNNFSIDNPNLTNKFQSVNKVWWPCLIKNCSLAAMMPGSHRLLSSDHFHLPDRFIIIYYSTVILIHQVLDIIY